MHFAYISIHAAVCTYLNHYHYHNLPFIHFTTKILFSPQKKKSAFAYIVSKNRLRNRNAEL